jgi:hypothetical protein
VQKNIALFGGDPRKVCPGHSPLYYIHHNPL